MLMPTIHFLLPDGQVQSIEAKEGLSLMEAAREEGVPGIVAECGGIAACSTCHVYIDEAWREVVGPPGDTEELTLDLAPEVTDSSRLSCQVTITSEHNGLRVRIPKHQAGY
jgi:2Fe-2S ferredoxin